MSIAAITVTVPGRPPTPNARRHWRVVAKDDQRWHSAAAWCAKRAMLDAGSPPPMARASLAVEFVVPDRRRRDLDNLVASIKPELDGIVGAGVIVDDSTTVLVSITYTVRYERGVTATVFTFTPAAP